MANLQFFNRLMMPFGEIIEKIPILPANKQAHRAKGKLDSVVYKMIEEHKKKE
jgi:hypothetical protein